MKVLVFGGAHGQVATSLRRQSGNRIQIQSLGRDSVDFRVGGQITAAIQATDADVIINAAAYTNVDKAEHQPELAEQINHLAVAEIGRAAAMRAIPVLHISTDYVFFGTGETPWRPHDPTDPRSVYGASKARGEQALAQAGGCFAILRTSWVFSAGGQNFVLAMLRLGDDESIVRVVKDQIGGPTSADDIARALLTIAQRLVAGRSGGGVYHFSGAPDCSWAEFAHEIFTQAGRNVRVVPILSEDYPTVAIRPRNSRLDCASLEQEFGIFRPDWRVGLANVLQQLGAIS
ncbi:dTDP-4-dehydrorhamnose reductase [Litoreibacter janthinus]|uniref:dTDP-4-dehydrorhamnose reductase n=1 Tax=Litoreibacter janthinus TaxID=670154 RepID=A0A1I6ICN5_9RHOB|nr:dTDP-4-dehydrorhamnose reductase [Litoreibacter janthinus]SFR64492.1 dTDP-4-dehydrorhamnose reductase [Litoreibacter janthinus]